jgi:hypothetical protein
MNTWNTSYNVKGYDKQPSRPGDIQMKNLASVFGRPKRVSNNPFWEYGNSSQEELAKLDGKILVTTTVHQENGHINNK